MKLTLGNKDYKLLDNVYLMRSLNSNSNFAAVLRINRQKLRNKKHLLFNFLHVALVLNCVMLLLFVAALSNP